MFTWYEYALGFVVLCIPVVLIIAGGVAAYEGIRDNWDDIQAWRAYTLLLTIALLSSIIATILK